MSETTQTVLFRFQGLEVRGEKSCVGRFIKTACLYNLSAAKTIQILLNPAPTTANKLFQRSRGFAEDLPAPHLISDI